MYELQVEDMSCGGYVKGVTRSVQSIDNVAKADVDLTGDDYVCDPRRWSPSVGKQPYLVEQSN